MADEPTAEPTAEAPPETPSPAEPQAAEQPEEEPTDWDSLDATLAKAYERDPKTAADRLKKHRAIAGIAGNIAERRAQELSQQQEQQRQAEAQRKAHDDLLKLAQEKPLEFADMYLSHAEAEQARERVLAVERNAAKQIMEQIGAAYQGLPEWKELSDEEKTRLQEAVADSPEIEVLPRFNRAALDIVADRRAEKRLTDRLPKEIEAARKQWEAERLAAEQAPDLRSPSTTVRRRINWGSVPDEDFNKWWKERFGR